MILPDINLLVYASNTQSRFHKSASEWWKKILNAEEPIALPGICISGFVRIMTHPKILAEPLDAGEAFSIVDSWLLSPSLEIMYPEAGHFSIFQRLCIEASARGKITTDAYIAATAIEQGATIYTNDSDFSRFNEVKCKNPLN